MKCFLIFILLIFSLTASAEQGDDTSHLDEVETEADAGCMTPECLGVDGALGSPDVELAELCRPTLPEHCQQIKNIKLTTCYDDQARFFDNFSGAVSTAGGAGLSCVLGLWEGIVDFGVGALNLIGGAGKGVWNFTFDSEYREEALNTASFFLEQFSDSEQIKPILTDPILEEIDEWVACLNYRGRWEYICEGGIQIAGLYGTYKLGSFGKGKLQEFIGKRGRKEKLSSGEKYHQRNELRKKLSGSRGVNISELSPYQISRLKPEDMPKMNFSNLTDDIADLLSKRQLEAVPLSKIRQMGVANNGRTLSRLSDDQFRAVAEANDMSKMSFNAIEANIKRIHSADIAKLDQLDQISPAAFGQMSAAQIRGMSFKQVNDVTPEQEGALNDRLKEALKETRQKRKREDNKRKREEEQKKQEEQNQQNQEQEPKDDKDKSGEQQSQEQKPKDDKDESGEQQSQEQKANRQLRDTGMPAVIPNLDLDLSGF